MSMTQQEAIKLGRLVAGAREVKGLSVRDLGRAARVSYSWVSKLERGEYLDPSPQRLALVADALAIDPARIDRMTSGALGRNLPGLRTYFRTKYDLSPQQIADIEDYLAEHGHEDRKAA